jgi:predicted membrane channel-forming protein YqfA (hemolysin III family)
MALSYKTRRRLSLLILVIGLPIYILLAVMLVSLLPRQNVLLELVIYIVLGVAWALPFKNIFRGVGQADPDKDKDT